MPDLPNMAKLSGLIGQIYDTCFDEKQWDPFLVNLTKSFGSEQALRVSIDWEPLEDGAFSYVGMDMDVVSQWAESKDHVDVWYSGLRRIKADTAYRGLDLCSRRALHKSAFYTDSLRALGIEHTLGAVCIENADRKWAFAIYHDGKSGRFTDEQAQAFGLLTAHFRRAIQLRKRLRRHRSTEAGLAAALEKSPFGIAILDMRQMLVWTNSKADGLFRAADGVTVNYGRIRLWDYESQKKFDSAIRRSILTGRRKSFDNGSAIAIPRPSGESAYHALVAPLNRGSRTTDGFRDASCIIVFHDVSESYELSIELLESLYGLSKAESRLCGELFRRGSLPDVIRALGISRNTAKTHLSRIFTKVGVENQVQLMHRLAAGIRLPGR